MKSNNKYNTWDSNCGVRKVTPIKEFIIFRKIYLGIYLYVRYNINRYRAAYMIWRKRKPRPKPSPLCSGGRRDVKKIPVPRYPGNEAWLFFFTVKDRLTNALERRLLSYASKLCLEVISGDDKSAFHPGETPIGAKVSEKYWQNVGKNIAKHWQILGKSRSHWHFLP